MRAESDRGFTIIELLVALTVLMIGIVGILAMQTTSLRGSSYTRHATEATVLGEDKMEEMRTIRPELLVSCPEECEKVNAHGIIDGDGFLFDRSWEISGSAPTVTVTITVSWLERGTDRHELVFQTQRSL